MGGLIFLFREKGQKSLKERERWEEGRKDDQETQEISCGIFKNKDV